MAFLLLKRQEPLSEPLKCRREQRMVLTVCDSGDHCTGILSYCNPLTIRWRGINRNRHPRALHGPGIAM